MDNFGDYKSMKDMATRMNIKKIDIGGVQVTHNTTDDDEITLKDYCIYF